MAGEDFILVEYRGRLDKLEADLKGLEKNQRAVETGAKAFTKTIETGSNKAATSVNKVDKEVSGLKNKLSDLAGRIPGVFAVQEVLGFGNAIKGAAGATGGMTNAMKLLKVAVIGSGIGALAIALLALISYFKRTDEGATKLEGVMGALGAATDEVTGFIAELGSAIFTAFESMANFKQGLSDLGEFLVNNLFNRFKAFLVFGQAFGQFFRGDFSGALKTGADAMFQFATGVTNITDKASAFAERLAKAAKEAYDFAIAMDAISDAQRDLNVELSANEKRIVELIKQSRNHARSEEERKALLKEANELEETGLNKQLVLENKKLVLIQDRNKREKDSINQRLNADLALAKTETERFKLKQKALSINDDLAQEEADQIIKINNIEKASIALKERNLNSIAALDEEIIQNHLANIKANGIAEENIYKEQYANRLITEKQLQDGLVEVQIDSLLTQKAFLQQHGRETVEIDKAIQDLRVKQVQDADKAILDEKTKAAEELKSFRKAEADYDEKQREERDKKELEDLKKKEAQKKQILSEAIDIAGALITAFNQRKLDDNIAEIESERSKNENETASLIANLEKRKEAGLLSETSFASKKEAILKKAAKKEADLKLKAWEAQRKADLTTILINTAVSIAKTLATLGWPAGAVAAIGAAAEGAAQYAIVASRKAPKFKDGVIGFKGKGTGTSDENHVMISNDESVITAKGTRKYRGLLQAVNDDTVEKYLTSDRLSPIIARQQKIAQEKENRLKETALHLATMANNNQLDTSHMERLIKRNKSVSIENAADLARLIAKENGRRGQKMI